MRTDAFLKLYCKSNFLKLNTVTVRSPSSLSPDTTIVLIKYRKGQQGPGIEWYYKQELLCILTSKLLGMHQAGQNLLFQHFIFFFRYKGEKSSENGKMKEKIQKGATIIQVLLLNVGCDSNAGQLLQKIFKISNRNSEVCVCDGTSPKNDSSRSLYEY